MLTIRLQGEGTTTYVYFGNHGQKLFNNNSVSRDEK